jgi:pimeloyl-ACP methyl ester carboxylesterase
MTDIIFHSAGAGQAVLLLHAFPLCAGAWAAQMSDLSAYAAAIAPDLPGFGASNNVPTIDDLDALATIVSGAARRRGIDGAVVVGNSMGGYLAFALLRVDPGFVRGLALVNTKATADTDQGRANRLALAQRVEREGSGFLVDEWPQGAVSAVTLRERPSVIRSIKEMVGQATASGVIAAQRAMAGRPDSTPLLSGIRMPTVVIHGLDDAIVSEAEARAMAGAIPGAAFVGIPDAGHVPNIEDPAPVNAALRALLGAAS